MSEQEQVDVQALIAQAEALYKQATERPLDTQNTPLGELVTKWFDLKKEVDKLSEVTKKIKSIQDTIEHDVVERMEKEDMDRVSTKAGTISMKAKSMPSVEDFYAFIKWVAEDIDNRLGFLQKRVNDAAVNEMLENNGALPPGVKTYMQMKLTKRSAKN